MSKVEAMEKLGGSIALLKAQSTLTFELCAREAAQIFGGLAYTRGGLGEKVERLYREVRAYAVRFGSRDAFFVSPHRGVDLIDLVLDSVFYVF